MSGTPSLLSDTEDEDDDEFFSDPSQYSNDAPTNKSASEDEDIKRSSQKHDSYPDHKKNTKTNSSSKFCIFYL